MKQVAGLISTYSSDEFGICSALFELGGMVVMHDASGCNSTYTTHDEPRWYDMDSMIYISAISELEAIMGDDEKLIGDLVETASELQPKFIAIVGAPIPYMIGTDLEAIAAITEQKTGIPSMGFQANGMHHYTTGISMALDRLAERFCKKEVTKTAELSVNILGATPLDFSLNGSIDSIKNWLQSKNITVNTCFAMDSGLEEVSLAGRAHVNLVLSYGGLAAAKRLKKMFQIPYVVGVPFGTRFPEILAALLQKAAQTGEDYIAYQPEILREYQSVRPEIQKEYEAHRFKMQANQKADASSVEKTKSLPESIVMIGESVFSASLAAAIELERPVSIKVLCPLDTAPELLRPKDAGAPEEDDLIREIAGSAGLIADPLYRGICPETIPFYGLPHEAFSGRIYDSVNPNLINRAL